MNIEDLFEERKEVAARLTKLNAAISALQEICKHHWEYNGHTSHQDLFVCSECKLEEWK